MFDVQRFSVHDGPGIRTTVFFKGCPLRCAWCQNPESISSDPQLLLYPDLCIGCRACLAACPKGSDSGREPGQNPVAGQGWLADDCDVCGACVEVCPTGARLIAGRCMTVAEVVEQALRDKAFYGKDGGVTLGGGEPLAQWEFARMLADVLRAEGVNVALDTACAAPRSVVEDVPAHFDLVLADLKLVSSEKHSSWTGGGNAGILEALRVWSHAMAGRLWITVSLIPGVHDDEEIRSIADLLRSLVPAPAVRLLPYHRLGNSKYKALGLPVPEFSGDAGPLVEKARAILTDAGLVILEQ